METCSDSPIFSKTTAIVASHPLVSIRTQRQLSIAMSSTANSFYFRRRTIGRASTPPVWACYEQIQGDYSDSDSCTEDDEDYTDDRGRDSEDDEQQTSSHPPRSGNESDDIDMDMDDDNSIAGKRKDGDMKKQKDVKGKQRAVDPEPEPPMRQIPRKKRQHAYTLRPILTIQKSQGFVWNQDLFVPPYIKDRYIASTSPPNSRGIIPSSVSSNSSATDYEVEVVEIRVREGEIYDIIP